MKTELDTLRERAAEVIHAAGPEAPFLTPRQGEAICAFIVETMEAQRKWTEKAAAGGGQVWGTPKQIADRLGMDASHVSGMLSELAAAGKIRRTKEDAIPGRPMRPRYHIGDVEAAMMGLAAANDRKEARR